MQDTAKKMLNWLSSTNKATLIDKIFYVTSIDKEDSLSLNSMSFQIRPLLGVTF